eukprot:7464596-Prorocentrum_lima.AAC.1
MSLLYPNPHEGGLIAGSNLAVSPGDLYGTDMGGIPCEKPSRPGTCELAPGVDIRGGVASSGIASTDIFP